MNSIFSEILQMSFQGSILILAVLILRLLLQKAPKRVLCLLWLVVGLRLLVPVQIESPVSLQPDYEAVTTQEWIQPQTNIPDVPDVYAPEQEAPSVQPEAPVVDPPAQSQNPQVQPERNPVKQLRKISLSGIWLAGVLAMGLYAVISYAKLKKQVDNAVILEEGVWVSGSIDSPFLMGYVRPRIYLPLGLNPQEQFFVLAHERIHLQRQDHWWKLIGFCALSVHWFNPLVWIGYGMLCKDLEIACDETVVASMDLPQRKAYSAALVSCAAPRHHFGACPVAFGEVSVKERVIHVLSFKKPGFWISVLAVIAAILVGVFLLTSPEQKLPEPEIPTLEYETGDKAIRVSEQFNPVIAFDRVTVRYEGNCAIYHFDPAISQKDRDTCVYYSEKLLSRMELAEKPELVLIQDYDGAWTDANYLYMGDDFASLDYAARLIALVSGDFSNYGAAYGYADFIAVEEGWKKPDDREPSLTDSAARDLNWLCFREEFVSEAEIANNKTIAAAFARELIAAHGEGAYRDLIRKSGDVETVAEFNKILSDWYAASGLDYSPSEILYSMGGGYHDYLVKCRYATFYLPKDWRNGFSSEITGDEDFLHCAYDRVKHCFESSTDYMVAQQARLGLDIVSNDVDVIFTMDEISNTSWPYRLIHLNSIEDLPILYIYWITGPYLRTVQYPYYLYAGLADYISVTADYPYKTEWLRHCGKTGMQSQMYLQGDCNAYLTEMLKDVEDPVVIQRTRWDFGTYYFDDYYDKPGNGLATSFAWYLIEQYGLEAIMDYVYDTGREPMELDLAQEQKTWIAYLEEKYGDYPKYSES